MAPSWNAITRARPGARLTIVLDAWAIVALLHDEPGAACVERAVEVDGAVVSWINLGEVFYVEARARGAAAAAGAVEALSRRVTAEEPDSQLVLDAARIKANHRLAYTDAFAVATAERHRLPLSQRRPGDPRPRSRGHGRRPARVRMRHDATP